MTDAFSVSAVQAEPPIADLDCRWYGQKSCLPLSAVSRSAAEANARLISAAPELLEALKVAIDWIDPNEHGLVYPEQARKDLAMCVAAIAKAEGR